MKRLDGFLGGAGFSLLGALALLLFFTSFLILSAQPTPSSDLVLQAMKDEMDRARKLTLSNLEPPYFIQYIIDEDDNFGVTANLGGLLSRRRDRFRSPDVRVRVGDYKFDNTNFAGAGFGGSRYDLEHFPLENAYPVLRRYLWLETDSAYKGAVEAISRKRAALRNLTQSEQLNDFSHAEPVRFVRDFSRPAIDEEAWARRVRSLSAVFVQFPDVKNSSVELESSVGGYFLVNSEGSEVKEPENATYLRARAQAQAPDGMSVRDAVTFHSLDIARMANDAEMTRGVTALAENVVALAHAPKGEDYSGPVLFEGQAGAQILAEVLGRNLVLERKPSGGGGRGGGNFQNSELEGRVGARVLPDSFEVLDDPTQKEWRGRPLFGSYEVDRDGVMAKPVRLIEKGVLKNYLLTRQPVRGYEGSNGHARLPGPYGANAATIGNLFISSTDTVPAAELKKKLIELCKARSKPYGVIVRKMDFPSSGAIGEIRQLMSGQQGGRPVSMPILVYKIYQDGHEELVRGLRFRGLTARSLKDILAAGDDSAAFEYLENTAPFALIGGAGFTAETCVVAPSILIDDLELHPIEEELPKLPLVSAPDLVPSAPGMVR
jgi:predicted Zn-dependent protease